MESPKQKLKKPQKKLKGWFPYYRENRKQKLRKAKFQTKLDYNLENKIAFAIWWKTTKTTKKWKYINFHCHVCNTHPEFVIRYWGIVEDYDHKLHRQNPLTFCSLSCFQLYQLTHVNTPIDYTYLEPIRA